MRQENTDRKMNLPEWARPATRAPVWCGNSRMCANSVHAHSVEGMSAVLGQSCCHLHQMWTNKLPRDTRGGVWAGGSCIAIIKVYSPTVLAGMGCIETFLEGNLSTCIKSLKYSHALQPKSSTLKTLTQS